MVIDTSVRVAVFLPVALSKGKKSIIWESGFLVKQFWIGMQRFGDYGHDTASLDPLFFLD